MSPIGKSSRIYAWVHRSVNPAAMSNQVAPAEKGVAQVILFDHEGIWKAAREGNRALVEKLVELEGPQIVFARGAFGETILHQCLLFHTPRHLDLLEYLVLNHPGIIDLVYTDIQYQGEHALHMAIVKRDLKTVQFLCDNGADFRTPRANGIFFSKNGSLYYGETVLAFAACTDDKDIVDYLIQQKKADPNVTDSNGNSVLHMLAWWGMTEMYKYVKNLGGNPTLLNNDGLTPFLVAVDRGHVKMVAELINDNREVAWEYGPISCFMYPLHEMDSYRNEFTRHRQSALEIAIQRSDEAMLKIPLFVALLDSKWVAFARQAFLTKLFLTISYLILMTIMIALLPTDAAARLAYFDTSLNPTGIGPFRLALEIVIGPLCIINITWKSLLDILHHGIRHTVIGPSSYERWYDWIYLANISMVVISRAIQNVPLENSWLGLSAIIGWLYLLYYAQGSRSLGILVNIFYGIIIHDLTRWLILYMIVIVGFSQAFFLQMSQSGVSGWDSLQGSLMWMFRYSIGQAVYDDLSQAQVPLLTIGYMTFEVFLTSILFINLFIALMSQTFSRVIEMAESRWRLQWATLILAIEATQSRDDQANLRVGFPKGNGGENETHYLMFEQRDDEELPTSLVVASKANIFNLFYDWIKWQFRARAKKNRYVKT